MITPMSDITPMAISAARLPIATPTRANGMENMITNGPMKDSNCEAITMYTRITIRTTSMSMSRNISC